MTESLDKTGTESDRGATSVAENAALESLAAASEAKLRRIGWKRRLLFALAPALILFGGLEAGLWIDGFEYDGSSRLGEVTAGESRFWSASTQSDSETIYRFRTIKNRAPVGQHPPFPKGARNFDINEHGYRGPSFPMEKADPSTIRVLAYGDSVTFGMYLPLEETYPWLLTRDVQADGLNAEVLNFGLSSFTSAQNLWDFEARGDEFQPDILLLHIGVWNDFSVPSNRRTDANVRSYLQREDLLKNSPLVRNVKTLQLAFKLRDSLAKDIAKWRQRPAKKSKRGHRYAKEGQTRRVPIGDFEEIVDAFLEHAEVRGLGVLVVAPALSSRTMASLGEIANDYHDALMEIEPSERVKVVDLRPVVAANGGDALFFDNCHYNAAGCRVVADALRGPLEELIRWKAGRIAEAAAGAPLEQ